MKLRSIAISNILSFGYHADINQCQPIQFDEQLNILVGPNGVGKSNLLEILNYVFKILIFKPYQLEDDVIDNHQDDVAYPSMLKNCIQQFVGLNMFRLEKHSNDSRSQSSILVWLSFNEADRANLLFIYNNATSINAFISKYSQFYFSFNAGFDVQNIMNLKNIELLFQGNNGSEFKLVTPSPSGWQTFVMQFLEHFELLKAVISVANRNEGVEWPSLRNPFALINAFRNYESFVPGYKIEGNENSALKHSSKRIKEQSARSMLSGEPAVFEQVRQRLSYEYNQLLHAHGKANADEMIGQYHLLSNINELIGRPPLGLKMTVTRVTANRLEHDVQFTESLTNKPVPVYRLSGGQKSLLHLVFSLYGFDLANNLMLVDEPELHLHIQSQEEYLKILRDIAKDLNIQFILVSHSPAFINATDIHSIYRCYLEDGFTRVVHPEITASDKEIMQIINLANASKIFFCKKIILVEGETDEFFYRFLLSELIENGSAAHGVAILNIKGKGNYKLWKSFLDKFSIPFSFFGDWDNVAEFSVLSNTSIRKFAVAARIAQKAIKQGLESKRSLDVESLLEIIDKVSANPSDENLNDLTGIRDYIVSRQVNYKKIIEYLKNHEDAVFKEIQHKIAELRKDAIYLMAGGEIEDYLDIPKGMESMIRFIKTGYSAWKLDNPDKYDELTGFLRQAVQSSIR